PTGAAVAARAACAAAAGPTRRPTPRACATAQTAPGCSRALPRTPPGSPSRSLAPTARAPRSVPPSRPCRPATAAPPVARSPQRSASVPRARAARPPRGTAADTAPSVACCPPPSAASPPRARSAVRRSPCRRRRSRSRCALWPVRRPPPVATPPDRGESPPTGRRETSRSWSLAEPADDPHQPVEHLGPVLELRLAGHHRALADPLATLEDDVLDLVV